MNSCRRAREESMANYKQRDFSLVIIVIMSSWCLRLLSSVRACRYKLKPDQNQTALNVFRELVNTGKSPLMHIAMVLAALVFSQKVFICLPNILVWNRTGSLDWKGQSKILQIKNNKQGLALLCVRTLTLSTLCFSPPAQEFAFPLPLLSP